MKNLANIAMLLAAGASFVAAMPTGETVHQDQVRTVENVVRAQPLYPREPKKDENADNGNNADAAAAAAAAANSTAVASNSTVDAAAAANK